MTIFKPFKVFWTWLVGSPQTLRAIPWRKADSASNGSPARTPEESVFFLHQKILFRLFILKLGLENIRYNLSQGAIPITEIVDFCELLNPLYDEHFRPSGEPNPEGRLQLLLCAVEKISRPNASASSPNYTRVREALNQVLDHLDSFGGYKDLVQRTQPAETITPENVYLQGEGFGPESVASIIAKIDEQYVEHEPDGRNHPRKSLQGELREISSVAETIALEKDRHVDAMNRAATFYFQAHLLPLTRAITLLLDKAKGEGVPIGVPFRPAGA